MYWYWNCIGIAVLAMCIVLVLVLVPKGQYCSSVEEKLQTHMCRLTVTNPTCGDYYTKNWILVNGCTRIFSSSKKQEVLFLHSKMCLENKNSCPDLPSYYDLVNFDGTSFHAFLDTFYSRGKIAWQDLHGDYNIRI